MRGRRLAQLVAAGQAVLALALWARWRAPPSPSAPQPTYAYVELGPDGAKLEQRTCGGGDAPTGAPAAAVSNSTGTQRRLVLPLIFFNEHELLEAKLEEAYDVADLFVVIESPFTFRGAPKPLHFAEALCARYARFAPKIAHVVLAHDAPQPARERAVCERQLEGSGIAGLTGGDCTAWHREFQGRLAFLAAAKLLGMADRDVVLQADTDEIPTAAALLEGANLLWNGVGEEGVAIPVVDLRMQTYSLSLSHMVTEPERNRVLNNRAKMFQFAARHTCSLQSIRSDWLTDSCPQHKIVHSLEGAGIHATFFLTPDKIRLKQKSYAHKEFDRPLNMSAMLAEEWDPQGFRMKRSDPEADVNLLRFSPPARALLLAHTAELDRQQRAPVQPAGDG